MATAASAEPRRRTGLAGGAAASRRHADAQGEIWLQCYPRVLGYSFKPVSFGTATAATAACAPSGRGEQHLGERHAYMLDQPRYGQELQARKAFHVSPFCAVEGGYRFEFRRSGPEGLGLARVRIDYHDAEGPVLTSVAGQLEPLHPPAAAARCGATPC